MPAIPALESGGRLEFKTSSLARPYLKTPMKRNRYMTNVYFISNAATSQYKEIKFFCLVNMLLVCLLVSSLIFLLWITNLKKKKKVRRCHFFFSPNLSKYSLCLVKSQPNLQYANKDEEGFTAELA